MGLLLAGFASRGPAVLLFLFRQQFVSELRVYVAVLSPRYCLWSVASVHCSSDQLCRLTLQVSAAVTGFTNCTVLVQACLSLMRLIPGWSA